MALICVHIWTQTYYNGKPYRMCVNCHYSEPM